MQLKYHFIICLACFAAFSCNPGLEEQSADNNTTSQDSTTLVISEDFENNIDDAENENAHANESEDDYAIQSDTVFIILKGETIECTENSVVISNTTATISQSGIYNISGQLNDGQLVINSNDSAPVHLILNGADIFCSHSAPLYISNAKKTVLKIEDQTENTLSDGSIYTYSNDEDEPNATLFSKDDLLIYGEGKLTINALYNDAIASKDGLIISNATIMIDATDDGIRGKDYLLIHDGSFSIRAGGDGLKSDNEDDYDKGYINIENGSFTINSGNDAIQAYFDILISSGTFDITTANGSDFTSNESAKGLKATTNIIIEGGTFDINSADDAIHSNGSIVVSQGTFQIATGDDGIHADSTLTINGGEININKSYEGLESATLTINDGNIVCTSSDDGLNVAGGTDGSGMQGDPPGRGDGFATTGNYNLYINGGFTAIYATGDGIDVNGSFEMTAGTVLVHGPTENMNGALDYDRNFVINGGLLVAVGSSGMAQSPGITSQQYGLMVYISFTQNANSLIHIENQQGETILSFAPSKRYQLLTFSSPELTNGDSYTIYTGGSEPGTSKNGWYQSSNYSLGSKFATFTINSKISSVGQNR